MLYQDNPEPSRLLPSAGGQPALTLLTSETDVDEGVREETAETTVAKPVTDIAAADGDSAPADNQEVKAEASATRLVNAEWPLRRRLAQLFSFDSSNIR